MEKTTIQKTRSELIAGFKETLRKKREWLEKNKLQQITLGELMTAN